MPTWKRRLLTGAKWLGGAAAVAGGVALAGAGAVGAGALGAGALLGYGAANVGLAGAAMLGLGGGAAYAAHRAGQETAEERMARWHARGEARRDRDRTPTGRYLHGDNEVTISGINRQRISQTNRDNYGGASLGAIPEYSQVRGETNYPGATRAIFDPDFVPPPGLTARQRIGTALSAAISNVSEGDKIFGIPKLIRGLARRHAADPTQDHPLDPAVNPAVSSAPEGRALMSGATALTPSQRDAVDNNASDSSDEEQEDFALRTGVLRRLYGPEKKSRRNKR